MSDERVEALIRYRCDQALEALADARRLVDSGGSPRSTLGPMRLSQLPYL